MAKESDKSKIKNVSILEEGIVILLLFIRNELVSYCEKDIETLWKDSIGTKITSQRIYQILNTLKESGYLQVDLKEGQNGSPKPVQYFRLDQDFADSLLPSSRVPMEAIKQLIEGIPDVSNGHSNGEDKPQPETPIENPKSDIDGGLKDLPTDYQGMLDYIAKLNGNGE